MTCFASCEGRQHLCDELDGVEFQQAEKQFMLFNAL